MLQWKAANRDIAARIRPLTVIPLWPRTTQPPFSMFDRTNQLPALGTLPGERSGWGRTGSFARSISPPESCPWDSISEGPVFGIESRKANSHIRPKAEICYMDKRTLRSILIHRPCVALCARSDGMMGWIKLDCDDRDARAFVISERAPSRRDVRVFPFAAFLQLLASQFLPVPR